MSATGTTRLLPDSWVATALPTAAPTHPRIIAIVKSLGGLARKKRRMLGGVSSGLLGARRIRVDVASCRARFHFAVAADPADRVVLVKGGELSNHDIAHHADDLQGNCLSLFHPSERSRSQAGYSRCSEEIRTVDRPSRNSTIVLGHVAEASPRVNPR